MVESMNEQHAEHTRRFIEKKAAAAGIGRQPLATRQPSSK
jgi:hypothetical protein